MSRSLTASYFRTSKILLLMYYPRSFDHTKKPTKKPDGFVFSMHSHSNFPGIFAMCFVSSSCGRLLPGPLPRRHPRRCLDHPAPRSWSLPPLNPPLLEHPRQPPAAGDLVVAGGKRRLGLTRSTTASWRRWRASGLSDRLFDLQSDRFGDGFATAAGVATSLVGRNLGVLLGWRPRVGASAWETRTFGVCWDQKDVWRVLGPEGHLQTMGKARWL